MLGFSKNTGNQWDCAGWKQRYPNILVKEHCSKICTCARHWTADGCISHRQRRQHWLLRHVLRCRCSFEGPPSAPSRLLHSAKQEWQSSERQAGNAGNGVERSCQWIQWHLQDFKLGLRLIGDVQRHVGAGDRAHSFTLRPVPKSGSWWMFTTCISIQFHTYIIYPSKGHGFLQFEVLKLGCWSLLKENVDSSNIVWWTNHFPWFVLSLNAGRRTYFQATCFRFQTFNHWAPGFTFSIYPCSNVMVSSTKDI